jgi:hypothetical protein
VKRVAYILLVVILILGAVYVYRHRVDLGIVSPAGKGNEESTSSGIPESARPANIAWEAVDRTSDGFKVEMPVEVKQIQVPAYNFQGGAEQVDMLYSYPNQETCFAVSWADEPPVERANSDVPDKTLDMARDDAMQRTETTLVSETTLSQQGFPARDFSARNIGGGVFNARLILARKRLYMLTATFPSVDARREQDVIRFFNSFSVVAGSNNQ